jgi:hypothetical protein
MSLRNSAATAVERWFAKGRWAYVWRVATYWIVLMTAFWLTRAGLANLGWGNPAGNWLLPPPHPITVAALLERVGLNAVTGLVFGWIMSYQMRPRGGSRPAV